MTTAPPTILNVEDDPTARQALNALLRHAGFQVREAATGREALRLAQDRPDLVLLDVGLPDLDGVEVCRRLKADPRTADVPVLHLSGQFVSTADRVRGLQASADGYLTKPVEPDELLAHVRALLRLRHAEDQAAQARSQLAALVESSQDAILGLTLEGLVTTWNAGAERLYGYPAAEAVGRPAAFLVPPDRSDELPAVLRRLQRGERVPPFEAVRVHRGGGRIDVSVCVSPVRDAAGRVVGASSIARDISDRKRVEAERDELVRRLQMQIERMPLAYLLTDGEFRIIDWNPAAERVFGYAKEEVLGLGPPFEKLLPPSAWPQADAVLRRLRAGDMAAHAVNDNRTKDGRTITCEWFNTPILGGDGSFQGVLSLAQDVTERLRLEERYRQAQKMEAVGQLAGGVAHDFNNLLCIVTGYSDLLLASLQPEDPLRGLVDEIKKAGERSASLTRQLLAFSRKQVVVPKVLDLNAVVLDVERMLRRLIGEDVQLVTSLDPDLGSVQADPGQLEQVLLNLAVNARDAMPRGGKLLIQTTDVELGPGHPATLAGVRPGPYVRLAVSDTGHGMTPEVKARVFEPFFTTKGPGKGTGLGLATVYGIVEQAGGHVEVDSEPGAGTTFRVYLPRAERQAQRPNSLPGLRGAPRGTETVLLVEDEDAVRALSRHVLESAGYAVLEARDGDEAVRVCERHPGPVHLLVSDVVMPGLGGRPLSDRLLAVRPRMRVLFLSGYTDDAVVRHGVREGEVHFLQKPFSPKDLAGKVREVLDSPEGRP